MGFRFGVRLGVGGGVRLRGRMSSRMRVREGMRMAIGARRKVRLGKVARRIQCARYVLAQKPAFFIQGSHELTAEKGAIFRVDGLLVLHELERVDPILIAHHCLGKSLQLYVWVGIYGCAYERMYAATHTFMMLPYPAVIHGVKRGRKSKVFDTDAHQYHVPFLTFSLATCRVVAFLALVLRNRTHTTS